jgi:hypothetical protein
VRAVWQLIRFGAAPSRQRLSLTPVAWLGQQLPGFSGHLHAMKSGLSRHWADYPEALDRDPGNRKWMVRCAGCGRPGLRADAPERFWNRLNLEKLGRLRLDERGLCEQCGYAEGARIAAEDPG